VIEYLHNWADKDGEECGWRFRYCDECNQQGDDCICGEIDTPSIMDAMFGEDDD
jgi:hypothetical protein